MRRLVRLLLVVALVYPAFVLALALAYIVVPPVSTLMLARWLSGESVARSYVSLAQISPQLPAAVIASEDARFCQHGGVDWSALHEVITDEEGPSRGASTIPMQVAKNLFLWPSRSYVRKALEIPLAIVLDLLWSKRRMIEVYLNVAEWGEGTFGAEAAARRHFGKGARELSRREAALLAAALPNPLLRNPGRPSGRLRGLAGRIQVRMEGTPTDCLRQG
ncbi:monofunctional biosynthetic peptidoglycan transglycosylase [Enterovirga aerilata]|uniref:Biosynthetic peptidoglycan transglycosylase n=1 Tax=Enterovirga aerilata TaxID=2730920 RepID=A0A849I4D8_9HYPH|nr:monofunctional biosynthetic peptidoglycan transglycosylase [Enterovirga sp. DB1703]NNM71000.1 monofunctional biosynthetic peptidoglycan transglycosylase [Enterovirga sp. DB1703]